MKKHITSFIIIIALLIPTVIAVKSYFDAQNAPASSKNALSLQIDDLNGNSYVIDKENDPEELAQMIDYYTGINAKATKILALPDSVSGQKFFKVTIRTPIKDESYQYFISTTPSLCYMVDPNGSAYQIAEADAAKFLNSKYAESLYPGATRPTLTVSNEFNVAPKTSVWKYKTYSSEFVTADTTNIVTDKTIHYDINGSITVKFDIEPDLCTVKITDSTGLVIFDDSAANLANLMIDEETEVVAEITAKWYEESARDYFGENTYCFSATLKSPAAFYVSKTEIESGKFITLSAKSVDDISKIIYECEPDLGVTPTFYPEGDYVHALLPISLETETGTYVITLSYGSTVQTVNLKVVKEDKADSYVEVLTSVLDSCYSDAAVTEFDELVKSLAGTTSDKRMFDGYFLSKPGDAMLSRGYGRKIILNNDPEKSFINPGVNYRLYQGSSVPALNAGTVVYSGTTAFSGNTVVIDHGMGLKTWYWGLDSTSVENGTSVSRGDEIGKSGTTGLLGIEAGFEVAMSIGDMFVCPYDAWDDGEGGIVMEGVYKAKE